MTLFLKKADQKNLLALVPGVVAVLGITVFVWWLMHSGSTPLSLRVPGTDHAPGSELGTNGNAVIAGKLIHGEGQPSKVVDAWPQFRGINRDGISKETGLARSWPGGQPRELW